MNIALRQPRMTRAEFFAWADARGGEGRYEFDGFQPVAMVGVTRNHGRIAQNIYSALRTRLRGGPCEVLGSDAGLATIGEAVRYPDALVSCAKGPGQPVRAECRRDRRISASGNAVYGVMRRKPKQRILKRIMLAGRLMSLTHFRCT